MTLLDQCQHHPEKTSVAKRARIAPQSNGRRRPTSLPWNAAAQAPALREPLKGRQNDETHTHTHKFAPFCSPELQTGTTHTLFTYTCAGLELAESPTGPEIGTVTAVSLETTSRTETARTVHQRQNPHWYILIQLLNDAETLSRPATPNRKPRSEALFPHPDHNRTKPRQPSSGQHNFHCNCFSSASAQDSGP